MIPLCLLMKSLCLFWHTHFYIASRKFTLLTNKKIRQLFSIKLFIFISLSFFSLSYFFGLVFFFMVFSSLYLSCTLLYSLFGMVLPNLIFMYVFKRKAPHSIKKMLHKFMQYKNLIRRALNFF